KGVRRESREGFIWRGEPILADAALARGITLDRLDTRKTLLGQLDDQLRRAEGQPALARFDRDRQRAFSLLTAARLKTAFDLDAEAPRLRDRYGRTLVGSSTLVARRLIEAGVRFVNVTWEGNKRAGGFLYDIAWDTHWDNFSILRKVLLPNFDQIFSALMEDLDNRGLLDETLVAVLSDFGRTPQLNATA